MFERLFGCGEVATTPKLFEMRSLICAKCIDKAIQLRAFFAEKQFCGTKVDQFGGPFSSKTFK